MSLIDEALKRARMEAAQRAAEGEGLPYPTIPRHLSPRPRRRWLAPAVVAAAVLAGLLAGWLMASRDSPGELTAAQNGAATAAAPAPTAAPGDTAAASTPDAAAPPRPAPASPPPAEAPRIATEPVAATEPAPRQPAASTAPRTEAAPAEEAGPEVGPAGESLSRSQEAPPPADPAPQAPQSAAPAPASTTAVTDPESGVLLVLPDRPGGEAAEPGTDAADEAQPESYVQRYPLPSGGAIELGGIAWSETGPFALINGRVMGPGSVIETFTLERIRPGHVLLTGNGQRIHLSLK